eukprot:Gb_00035 [translate_table: standard]
MYLGSCFVYWMLSRIRPFNINIHIYMLGQIEPQLLSGKNVLIAAHGNSLRSIIMYLDKLTSQEVISLELSTGIPMLYIMKQGKFIRRGSPIGPTEAGVYAFTRNLALYRQKLDDMIH